MNLEKKKLHTSKEKGRAFSQITLEEDYNLPDYKPDFMRQIHQKGELIITNQQVEDGHVRIQGTLRFEILYRSDQEGRKIQSLKGEIPFQERQNLEAAKEFDPVRIEAQMEDISIRVINSRKLGISSLVELTSVIEEQGEQELLVNVEDDSEYELERDKVRLLEFLAAKRDICRFERQLQLPSNKPNMEEILWKSIQLRNMDTKVEAGQVNMKGELLLAVVYNGEGEEDSILYFESSIPFRENIEVPEAVEEGVSWIPVRLLEYSVEIGPDEDGESRMLKMEIAAALELHLWKEEDTEYVRDVYCLKKELVPARGSITGTQFVFANRAKNKLSDNVELEEQEPQVLQILSQWAQLGIESQMREEKGLLVEGTIEVQYLYLTADAAMPLLSGKVFLPFRQLVEVDGMQELDDCLLDAGIEQLSITAVDSRNLEVRCTTWVKVLVLRSRQIDGILDLKEQELDYDALERSPGIVGYLVKEGDRLFTIAKENHTTVKELMEMNQLETNVINGGDRLLIIKKV